MPNAVKKWTFLNNLRKHIIKTNGVIVNKTDDLERFNRQKTTITLFVKKKNTAHPW